MVGMVERVLRCRDYSIEGVPDFIALSCIQKQTGFGVWAAFFRAVRWLTIFLVMDEL